MRNEVLSIIMKNEQNLSNRELSALMADYHNWENKERRLAILQGYLVAEEHLDTVVDIVIKRDPSEELMRKLGLTKVQAQALLELPIKRLMWLNRQNIETEINQLSAWIKDFNVRWKNFLGTEPQK